MTQTQIFHLLIPTRIFRNNPTQGQFYRHVSKSAKLLLLRTPLNPSRHTKSFQRLYDVYTPSPTSYRRYIDVETTSCVYWDGCLFLLTGTVMTVIRDTRSTLNRLFTIFFVQSYTARKVSVFGVFLARIFPHSD